MSYGPHVPEWTALCELLAEVRDAMLAMNAFVVDTSGALLARAWVAFGEEQEAVLDAAEWYATTRPVEHNPRVLHERGIHVVLVPFGGIYAVAATYEELPPTHSVAGFEAYRKPLIDLLSSLPPVDGPEAGGGRAALRVVRG